MSLFLYYANVCAALCVVFCTLCYFICSRLLLLRFVSLYAPRFSRNSQEHYVNNKYKTQMYICICLNRIALAVIAKKSSETTKLLTMDVQRSRLWCYRVFKIRLRTRNVISLSFALDLILTAETSFRFVSSWARCWFCLLHRLVVV